MKKGNWKEEGVEGDQWLTQVTVVRSQGRADAVSDSETQRCRDVGGEGRVGGCHWVGEEMKTDGQITQAGRGGRERMRPLSHVGSEVPSRYGAQVLDLKRAVGLGSMSRAPSARWMKSLHQDREPEEGKSREVALTRGTYMHQESLSKWQERERGKEISRSD